MHAQRLFAAASLAIAGTLSLGACTLTTPATPAAADTAKEKPAAMSDADLLARGDYLVRIAGCNDCHTPAYGERALLNKGEPLSEQEVTLFALALRTKLANEGDDAVAVVSPVEHFHTPAY